MSASHGVETSSTSSTITKSPWRIASTTLPISNASEITALQDDLNGLPLPEMIFGNNSLVIKNEEKDWEYRFDTAEALRMVKLGELGEGDGAVKVGYAKEWLQSRYVLKPYAHRTT